MRTHWLLVLLLGLVLVAGTGAAQRGKGFGTLAGRVLNPAGQPVEGARVTLQASEGKRPQTTETNSQGRFWFASLPVGLYDVRATREGRSSEWRKNVWVARGKQTNVTLHLRPKKNPPGD